MRGPAPTPTEVLEARGSWRGAARRKAGVPRVRSKIPRPPKDLSDAERATYRELGKALARLRCVTDSDAAGLEALAKMLTMWRRCQAEGRDTPIVKVNGQLVPHPALSMANKLWPQIAKLLAELGMTPSARARISAVPEGTTTHDPKTRFFTGPRMASGA